MVYFELKNISDILHVFYFHGLLFYNHKDDFCNYLNSLGDFQNGIIVGDLNTAISSKERRAGSLVRDDFGDLITNLDEVDIKPKKGVYTWKTKRFGPSHISAHIDRFLVNSSLL